MIQIGIAAGDPLLTPPLRRRRNQIYKSACIILKKEYNFLFTQMSKVTSEVKPLINTGPDMKGHYAFIVEVLEESLDVCLYSCLALVYKSNRALVQFVCHFPSLSIPVVS